MNNILRRDKHFDLKGVDIANWHSQGYFVSQFYNAASLLFPDGERFFIHSIRNFQDKITDQKLLSDVKGFIGQEAMHGREHEDYNQKIADAGYPSEKILKKVNKLLELGKKYFSDNEKLRTTMALEHFTAIMANVILEDERKIDCKYDEIKKLWIWHAVEETEHKCVAYDVYLHAVCNNQPETPKMARKRKMTMVRSTLLFWYHLTANFLLLIKKDKQLTNFKEWKTLLKFLFGRDGFVAHLHRNYWDYYKKGFHPSIHNNFELASTKLAYIG